MAHKLYAFDSENKRAWKVYVSPSWIKKHDNGHLVSIGIELGKDIDNRELQRLSRIEVSYDEWKHSGCQSRCIKRGDEKCQW